MADDYFCAAAPDIDNEVLALRDWKRSNGALLALFLHVVKYYRNLNARGPRN